MVDRPPGAVIENHFAVPVPFAAAWLTDFRPDDGQKWFGLNEQAKVDQTPSGFHIEGVLPFGRNVNDILLESPTHWTAQGRMENKRGKVIALTRLDERVTPEGPGTLHRVQMWIEPQGLGARIMFAFARRSMRKGLNRAFSKMKFAMEQESAQATSGPVPP
jgi:hypothetical protein